MAFFAAQQAHIFYQTLGQPGRPAIVLFHGFTGSFHTWEDFARHWQSRYFVVMPDLPGHHHSGTPWRWEDCELTCTAKSMVDLMKALGYTQFRVLGYSLGGRLALHLAAFFPHAVTQLVLESTTAGLPTEEERRQRRQKDWQLAQQIETQGISWFVDYWSRLPLFSSQLRLSPEVWDRQQTQRRRHSPLGLAQSLRGAGTGQQQNLWPYLPRLSIPVQLIVGSCDSKFQQIGRQMQQALPNARTALIPQAGHAVHLEQPQRFFQTVTEFWNS
ncbi:MAG: 2-succinyl-6-hydroxy-2,4-cyclohexadiene-1-carboxylate synthase [Firmicutes bacterium]|nr:2-succinyl-6-hydroxy-2,4-cyclohexadiene-1-carboxylate synthase [Bacillota bacterium]